MHIDTIQKRRANRGGTLLLAVSVLALAGCWRAESKRDLVTVETETHQLGGSVAGQPVQLQVTTTRESETVEESSSRSGVDGAAIGQAVGQAVRQAIGQATGAGGGGLLSSLGGVLSSPEGGGLALATLLGAGGIAVRERRKRRAAECGPSA